MQPHQILKIYCIFFQIRYCGLGDVLNVNQNNVLSTPSAKIVKMRRPEARCLESPKIRRSKNEDRSHDRTAIYQNGATEAAMALLRCRRRNFARSRQTCEAKIESTKTEMQISDKQSEDIFLRP